MRKKKEESYSSQTSSSRPLNRTTVNKNNKIPDIVKKNRFEFLYQNFNVKNAKLCLVRLKNHKTDKQKMIPQITDKAKKINRHSELYFYRLYNSSFIVSNNNHIKRKSTNNINNKTNTFSNASTKNCKYPNEYNEDSLYIIDNLKENAEYKKLYTKKHLYNSKSSSSIPLIKSNSFFLDKNGLLKSTERLSELSTNQKRNLNEIMNKREYNKQKIIKENNDMLLFKLNNNKYIPNVKNNTRKRCTELYLKGLNSIKQKEQNFLDHKKIKETEYKKYSYSPILNHPLKKSNSSVFTNYFGNNTNLNIYERQKKWKENIDIKNKRKKNEKECISIESLNFSPVLNSQILKTDISFINKNSIEYTTFLQKINVI